MLSEEQSEVRAFLEREAGIAGTPGEWFETHISSVFLCDDRAYKLKNPVSLPYLDFSTPQARLQYCLTELSLNRRTAPEMYLCVRKIVRGTDGALAFGEEGELTDAVVVMARFDQEALLDKIVKQGPLNRDLVDALAKRIADFHAIAEVRKDKTGRDVLKAAHTANEMAFSQTSLHASDQVRQLLRTTSSLIDASATLLDARAEAGFVRHCHGDLHLRNICLFEGEPTLFDCLEFDETLATTDVLYDLAFLLMDLWHADQHAAANRLFNRYLDQTGDTHALGLMPLFMSIRATVRAHIAAGRADAPSNASSEHKDLTAEARGYVDLACAFLQPTAPKLIALGGLSGSGKSTAAAEIAPQTGPPPGARILSTDRIRKSLFGKQAQERLPQEAYEAEVSQRVYEMQRRETFAALQGGWSAIADGVFLREDERAAIAAVAGKAGATFNGIWLDAPEDRLIARVEARRNDPSDATAGVVQQQLRWQTQVRDWTHIDASRPAGATARAILDAAVAAPPKRERRL